MKVDLLIWDNSTGSFTGSHNISDADLVIFFGDREDLHEPYKLLLSLYPGSKFVGCSSAGQILNSSAGEHCFIAAVISFSTTSVQTAYVNIASPSNSYNYGEDLGNRLKSDNLKGILLLSDGTNINGSRLVRGISDVVGCNVTIMGGLAADGDRFEETCVAVDNHLDTRTVGAVGFYGDNIIFSCGSEGGWRAFGPKRKITKSHENILYEIDGEPALDLYERYLGDEAKGLPGTALLFPLLVSGTNNREGGVVRTILSIDPEQRSLSFAGNVPQGCNAQLMQGSFEDLYNGAGEAALKAMSLSVSPQLVFLVSCVGRRLVLGQYIENEIAAVTSNFQPSTPVFGFYSYGEICPRTPTTAAKLHNETMTVTIISEI